MTLNQGEVDIIATKILLDADQALKALRQLNEDVTDADGRIGELQKIIRQSAFRDFEGDVKKATAALRELATLAGFTSKEMKEAGVLAASQNPVLIQDTKKQVVEETRVTTEKQKQLDLQYKENIAVEQAGQLLSYKLLKEQQISDAKAKQKAASPQEMIPSFVKQQYGDINSYIDQSANKVQAWKEVVQASAKNAGVSFEKAGSELKKMVSGTTVAPLNEALRQLGQEGVSAFDRMKGSLNSLRIAIGALTAMITFALIQAVTQFFTGAIKNATEFEDTLYRLSNVEKELSMEGISVSVEGLRKGIQELKKQLPIFSQEDIAGLVGKIAISTKDLKYTETQILDLARAIGILNIRSTENETLNQTSTKIITALLSGTTKGISGLGVQMDDMTIKLKAVQLGFIRAGESVQDLTKQEKDLAKLQIILDSANGELETFDEYMKTNTARLKENKAAWEDLKTTVGQFLLPFAPGLTAIIDFLTGATVMLKIFAAELMTVIGYTKAFWDLWNQGAFKNISDVREAAKNLFDWVRGEMISAFFPEMPANVKPGSKLYDYLSKYIKPQNETATTGAPGIDENKQQEDQQKAKEHGEKLAEIMQDNADKLADIERDYQRKLQDIATDYAQKLEDINRDTAQKKEDALRDYNQKIEDVNRDANQAIADAQADFRQKEIDREREYQNKLRELREKFLFDLEDALRERDARQVLRLIRQYNMDKKNLEERKKLQKKENEETLKLKLEEIERERQLKLEAAKREYDDRLAEIAIGEQRALQDLAIWQARQLADARTWHQRQLAEQREYLKRKLQDLQKAYAQELALANSYSAALTALAKQGMTLYGMGIAQPKPTTTYSSGGSTYFGGGSTYQNAGGLAQGGTIIAKKPTVAVFGEKGAEMATFKPIGRSGTDVNKIFGDVSGMGETGGYLNLRMSISDGLIAEIVDTSLNNVATHLEHTRRMA